VPTFLELFGAMNSGTRPCQRVACHRYWNLILKKPAAPRLLGKDFKEAHHEPSIKTNQIGGMSREAHHPHSHFRIFASLPGLNDAATNRQRIRMY